MGTVVLWLVVFCGILVAGVVIFGMGAAVEMVSRRFGPIWGMAVFLSVIATICATAAVLIRLPT